MKFAYKTGARPLEGYTIKCGLGCGGFGEVYHARTDAGKDVALKRIQRNLDVEVRGVTQCLNLKHPNLVALYDLKYDDEGQAWVVMELIAGECLKDVIDRNPHGLPPEEAARWFQEIAAGVSYLHDHGIVHRDLKPGNIFADEGLTKIGDYGLSKFISASLRGGQTESVGTFHYMAPEIGKGVYGKQIDIYALGIILYEMLTGHVPFDGESSQEIIMKHLTDDPDVSAIPEPYRAVIQKALRKDPEKRYPSVREMALALQPAAATPAAGAGSPPGDDATYYIGEGDQPEMVFGPLKHHPVVLAEAVPPVRHSAPGSPPPRAAGAAGPRPYGSPAVPHAGGLRWSGLSVGGKIALVVALGLVVLVHPALLPLAAAVGLGYAVFVGCRALFAPPPAPRPPRGPVPAGRGVFQSAVWRAAQRQRLRSKPLRERSRDLTGSLLLTAVIAPLLTLVFVLLEGRTLDGSVSGWSLFMWLALSSVLGSWLMLLMGKVWEGDEGDHFRRRLVMLVAGLVFGGAVFALGDYLVVKMPDWDPWAARAIAPAPLLRILDSTAAPAVLARYLLYFGGLFVILRWWSQADPLRRSRFSLWATGLCVLWAWIMTMLCSVPQPWGVILAATISAATQLSAPWADPKQAA